MQKPIILDTTLRDGEQSPGLYFTDDEKQYIAYELDRLGIDIIEAGIPSMGKEERESLASLMRLGLKAEVLSWNRLVFEDVRASLKAGMRSMHLSVPTSDIMLINKLRKDRNWIFRQMESVICFAKNEGACVSLGAEDASRTDPVFLRQVFGAAAAYGASRVRFADTLGILTPFRTRELIAYLADGLSIPIDFHGHNDFGMATANALAAWEGGAQIISCSVLGLGERAGNTSLEEFAGVLRYLKGLLHDFDFVRLKDLCSLLASWTGSSIPKQKPLYGDIVFTHESGIHVDGILKEPATYEFFPPEQVGKERRLIPGKHSGRSAIRYLADKEGFFVTDDQIESFLGNMREQMAATRGIDAAMLLHLFLNQYGMKKSV